MTLDPAISGMLTMMRDAGVTTMSRGTPEQSRSAFRRVTMGMRAPESLAPVYSSTDQMLPGGLKVRIYRPDAEGLTPTVVFLHGGGFVMGDLDTHDDHARLICADVGAVVVSVDYRLAPEHQWPAALNDAVRATRWALARTRELGGKPHAVAIAGDSSGGNLAAAAALEIRNDSGPGLAAQLLIYPIVDMTADATYPSRRENSIGYFLTEHDLRSFAKFYVAPGTDLHDSRLSPLYARELGNLPATVVATAEYDPLRDEGEAFAHALARANVPVIQRRYNGLIHGFFGLGPLSPAAATASHQLCNDLKQLLAATSSPDAASSQASYRSSPRKD